MEKKWMLGLTLMTVLALYVAAAPQAGVSMAYNAALSCPTLLTELECAAFQTALTSLPAGEQRNRFIEDMHLSIADRESACSCNQAEQTEVLYPKVEQLALKL